MNSEFSNKLKAEARSLGFFACGIAQARPVDDGYARRFLRRVSSRTFADMEYMYRHVDLRLDPRLLVPGVQSIVSLALPYAPAVEVLRDELHLAAYALGKDYHDVMRQRMQLLVARLGITGGYRCFVDTAPNIKNCGYLYTQEQCLNTPKNQTYGDFSLHRIFLYHSYTQAH